MEKKITKLEGKQAASGNLSDLRKALEERQAVWSKASNDTKEKLIAQDPVLRTAYSLFRYLETYFFRSYPDGK